MIREFQAALGWKGPCSPPSCHRCAVGGLLSRYGDSDRGPASPAAVTCPPRQRRWSRGTAGEEPGGPGPGVAIAGCGPGECGELGAPFPLVMWAPLGPPFPLAVRTRLGLPPCLFPSVTEDLLGAPAFLRGYGPRALPRPQGVRTRFEGSRFPPCSGAAPGPLSPCPRRGGVVRVAAAVPGCVPRTGAEGREEPAAGEGPRPKTRLALLESVQLLGGPVPCVRVPASRGCRGCPGASPPKRLGGFSVSQSSVSCSAASSQPPGLQRDRSPAPFPGLPRARRAPAGCAYREASTVHPGKQ